MSGIKLSPLKSSGDGYKQYKSQLKNWMVKRGKIKAAKKATQESKKK